MMLPLSDIARLSWLPGPSEVITRAYVASDYIMMQSVKHAIVRGMPQGWI